LDDANARTAALDGDVLLRRRRRAVRWQDEAPAELIPADELARASQQSHAADPAAMPCQRSLASIGQLPALDGIVLGAGEHEPPRRIEPAREEWAVVPQLLDHARPHRIDPAKTGPGNEAGGKNPHASTSGMCVAVGSAIGMGRPSTK